MAFFGSMQGGKPRTQQEAIALMLASAGGAKSVADLDPRMIAALGVPVPKPLPESASADFGIGTHDAKPINVTPAGRYGTRPSIYGGGDMLSLPARGGVPLPMADNTAGEQPTNAPAIQLPAESPALKKKKHGGFGGFLKAWAGYLGDNLTNSHAYADAVERQRRAELPQQVGSSLIVADPSQPSGYRTIFRDPEPFEAYASSLGLRPGTPEYADAVQNYRLGGWGDEAVAAKTGLADHRYDRQGQLINQRYDRSDQQLGQRLTTQRDIAAGRDATSRSNTQYRVNHPVPRSARSAPLPTPSTVVGRIMDRQASGKPLSTAEQNTLKDYRTRRKPQPGAVQVTPNEPIAHGPNGQTLIVRNGRWVDAATGKPVQ